MSNSLPIVSSNGAPVESLTASRTAGKGGGILLEDFALVDHLAHFDRERIPERVVHAKGGGAFGYFEVTDGLGDVCRAHMFRRVGQRTPVAVRFSTVGGESGSADTARDPRGFAVKFYTEEGNWDLVGNNTPIFFVRDPILFPSFIHTQKRHPATHTGDADMFWDFIGLRPETVHQVSFLFSDRGTPDGYRHMNGYGSHAYRNVSADGQVSFVKYHFKTDQGVANLSAAEAARLAGVDADYANRDLYRSIAEGNFPSWTLYVQVMTPQQAADLSFDAFDVTKVWPHADFPLRRVGRLVLNRNPVNYFAEVEQLAFAPAHMVPGIEPSPDKMLQGRLFSYADTHRHRLGPNYQQIPVNSPWNTKPQGKAQFHYQRDGAMAVTSNGGSGPNYFPNSHNATPFAPSTNNIDAERASAVSTSSLAPGRYETANEDNFTQCRHFFNRTLDEGGRQRLTDNLAGHLANCANKSIAERAIANFAKVDSRYGQLVRDKLNRILDQRPTHTPETSVRKKTSPLNPPRDVIKDSSVKCPFGFSSASGYGFSPKSKL